MGKWARSASKAAQASTAEILKFYESEIPGGEGIQRYGVTLTGAARDFDALNWITVQAGGLPVWSCSELQHAAILQRLGKKAGPAAAATRFSIPFDLLNVYGPNVCSFPRLKNASILIDVDNTPSAVGTVKVSHKYADPLVETKFFPMYLATDGNIGASASPGRFQISQPGLLAGFTIPRTTSLTSIRVYTGNNILVDLDGEQFLEATEPEQGSTVSLNAFYLLDTPVPIVAGSSYIEVIVDGSFAATDDIALLTLVPQGTI